MKNIYKTSFQISTDNGKTWYTLTRDYIYSEYLEEYNLQYRSIDDFEELLILSEQKLIPNTKIKESFFSKQKKIIITYFIGTIPYQLYFIKSAFKDLNVVIRRQYEIANLTFDTAKNYLSAKQFCEFLKDNGITRI